MIGTQYEYKTLKFPTNFDPEKMNKTLTEEYGANGWKLESSALDSRSLNSEVTLFFSRPKTST
jgi:hypothetical protein